MHRQKNTFKLLTKERRHRIIHRTKQLHFMVSLEEESLILEKMKSAHMYNLSAYLRKMAIDGYIIQLDHKPLKEMLSLLRYSSNNINQIAKKANAGNPLLVSDIQQLQNGQQALWNIARQITLDMAHFPL